MNYAITHEEVANSITHFLGVLLAPAMLVWFFHFVPQTNWVYSFSAIVFCASVFSMYTASTVYHFVLPSHAKQILRYFDHINIYVLIAACYTPIFLCGVGGTLGWVMFAVEWLFALAGGVYKVFFLGKYPKLSLALYLLMGWSVMVVAKPVWEALPVRTLVLLALEGLLYTSGAYFFAHDGDHRYYHAVWHVFVLVATFLHFFLVLSLFC